MSVSLDSRVTVHPDVVFRELDGEAVILHLGTGLYYGLDAVGTRMWQVLAEHGDLGVALDVLAAEYDVSRERLRADLVRLVEALCDKGLVRVTARGAAAG
jgi:hypothetical protein